VIAGYLPSAILILPKPVSRSPPKTSSIYPSSISRALCSAGMRCIKPLAPSRNETNSSRVNVGADKTWAIRRICAYGWPVQASHPATIRLTHYLDGARRSALAGPCQPPGKPSSRGLLCSGGNPLATWRMIAPRSKYPTAARISALASSAPRCPHTEHVYRPSRGNPTRC
jgi:hypothetical protein